MGADYIGQVVTVAEERYTACTRKDIEEFLAPDETVQRLLAASYYLRDEVGNADYFGPREASEEEMAADERETARGLLLEGWETLNGSRTHNYWPLGRGLAMLTSGGMSWGDDPYDDFHAECALVDAALSDSELGALTGIVAGVPEVDFIESWIERGEGSA